MNDNKLQELKDEYMNTEIPDELAFAVKKALAQAEKMSRRRRTRNRCLGAAAAVVLLFAATLNTSPVLVRALADVPVLKDIVSVLTFREYHFDGENYEANLKVPAVTGLKNQSLENSLNAKYLEEGRKLYQDFISETKDFENSGGHLAVDSGYDIKTDNDQILSLGRWSLRVAGDSFSTMKYDTIDKKKEILITLPSLFKDDRYIGIISKNIKQQMREQMQADAGKQYWLENEPYIEPFEKIDKYQSFYINSSGKLVICFGRCEVAPNCMGLVEFIIPTEVIADELVSNEYIK